MNVRDTFNRSAAGYDARRRQLIPCFDAFYGTAARLLPPDPLRVLDLGAGTGLLAAAVRECRPAARIELLDVAEDMLSVARQRFAGDANVVFHTGDYATESLGGPYDAVVSALSIHHLENDDKRTLFRHIHAALAPGGRFINADQVAGPTPALDARYDEIWVTDIRALGIDDEQLAASRQRQTHDRLAPLDSQLGWLREAGFREVDCIFKSWGFVVYTGVA